MNYFLEFKPYRQYIQNVTSSSTANAALEAARSVLFSRITIWLRQYSRDIKAPIILQVSQGGSAYFAGKGLANDKQQASITGAVAAAHHIRTVAKAYGVYVLSLTISAHLKLNHFI